MAKKLTNWQRTTLLRLVGDEMGRVKRGDDSDVKRSKSAEKVAWLVELDELAEVVKALP